MSSVAILIPVHGAVNHFRKSLECATASPQNAVIVVDDGSPEPYRDIIGKICGANRVHYVRNARPRGYAHSINTAILYCLANGYDYLVVANSDTVWPPGAVRVLVRELSGAAPSDPVAVGPSLSRAGSGQMSDVTLEKYDSQESLAIEMSRRKKAKGYHSRTIGSLNGAFFMLDVRRAVQRNGFFDERFGRGSFEEEEYFTRSPKLCMYAPESCVWHAKGASFKEANVNTDKLWGGNKNKMLAKRNSGEAASILSDNREWPRKL